jgi:hypothetical protein
MITVTFACGHRAAVTPSASESPVCPCGNRTVRTVEAPAPRFTGVCHGPSATTTPLAGIAVPAASAPLVLKESR